MREDESKYMQHWIATVRHIAHQLLKIGANVTNEEIIITLMLGLPSSF
jgi:hypothetical protein